MSNNLKSLFPVKQCPVPIGFGLDLTFKYTVQKVDGNNVYITNDSGGPPLTLPCNYFSHLTLPGSVKKRSKKRGRKVSKGSKRKRSVRKLRSKRRKSKKNKLIYLNYNL